jgi:phage RecT family recombinase
MTPTTTSSSLMKIRQELNAPDFIRELTQNDSFKLDMARQVAFAIQHIDKSPMLQGCTPVSIKTALMNVALSGLTLNPLLQQADLIPRKNKDGETIAVLDISYKGIITKMIDFGVAIDVFANIVYENDDYDYENFTNTVKKHITWKKKGMLDSGKEMYVYGCIVRPDGTRMFRELPIEYFDTVMQKSESYKASKRDRDKSKHWKSIWEGEYRWQMVQKTMIKYMWKFIPKSEKMETLGLLIEESNYAHENTDNVITEDGQAVVLDNGKSSNVVSHTETQIKAVLSKKKEVEVVSVEVTKDGLESLVNAILEGYDLGDRKSRSLNEVKEILGLMLEKGFTRELLDVAFGSGGGGYKTIEDVLYKGNTDLIVRLLNKAYEVYVGDV